MSISDLRREATFSCLRRDSLTVRQVLLDTIFILFSFKDDLPDDVPDLLFCNTANFMHLQNL